MFRTRTAWMGAVMLFCTSSVQVLAQDTVRIARRIELGDASASPTDSVFTEKNNLFRITLPAGWKEVADAKAEHPWWNDEKGFSVWTFTPRDTSTEERHVRVFRFSTRATLDDVRAGMEKHLTPLRKIPTATVSEKDMEVGPHGGVGLGYALFASDTETRTIRSRDEVFIFFAANGCWCVTHEWRRGALRPGGSANVWDDIVKSFTVPSASDGNLLAYLPGSIRVGRTPKLLGLEWDGGVAVSIDSPGERLVRKQVCSWAANQFAVWYLGCKLPDPPHDDYWVDKTPGFRKVPYTGRNVPPSGSLLLFRRTPTSAPHIVVVLSSDPRTGHARVIEGHSEGRKGFVWDVHLPSDRSVLGWLVRE